MTLLEAARRRRRWNQTAVAFHANTSQGEISKIERRRMKPHRAQAERLGRVLGVPAHSLQYEVIEVADRA